MDPQGFESSDLGGKPRLGKQEWAFQSSGELCRQGQFIEIAWIGYDDVIRTGEKVSGQEQGVGFGGAAVHRRGVPAVWLASASRRVGSSLAGGRPIPGVSWRITYEGCAGRAQSGDGDDGGESEGVQSEVRVLAHDRVRDLPQYPDSDQTGSEQPYR